MTQLEPKLASPVDPRDEVPMARPLQIQIVEMARALIEDEHHWCRNHVALDTNGVSVFPTNSTAVKRCALGALIAAAYELTHDHDAADKLAYDALRPHCGTSTLIHINDLNGHAEVLALFDKVIAMRARPCGGIVSERTGWQSRSRAAPAARCSAT
jgi:hypothetical protein